MKGNYRSKNKITKFGLEDTVIELYGRGMSYAQIINEVMVRTGVQLSKASVSRYISRSDDIKRFTSDGYNGFRELRQNYTKRTNDTLISIDECIGDILSSVDISKRKALAEKLNELRKQYISNRNELVLVFDKLYEDNRECINFLTEISLNFCFPCRTKLMESIHKYEQSFT